MSPLAPQSPQTADPLAQLRDIHLPQETITTLPVAPGWWLLALLTIALLVTAIVFWRRQQKRNRYRRQAIQELNQIQPGEYHDQKFIQLLNTLLKRCSMAAYPNSPCGHLHGVSWLEFLQQSNPKQTLPDTIKDFWLHSSYARSDGPDENKLQKQTWQFAQHWIQQHLPERKLHSRTNEGEQAQC